MKTELEASWLHLLAATTASTRMRINDRIEVNINNFMGLKSLNCK